MVRWIVVFVFVARFERPDFHSFMMVWHSLLLVKTIVISVGGNDFFS
jgi:hypothetical protein